MSTALKNLSPNQKKAILVLGGLAAIGGAYWYLKNKQGTGESYAIPQTVMLEDTGTGAGYGGDMFKWTPPDITITIPGLGGGGAPSGGGFSYGGGGVSPTPLPSITPTPTPAPYIPPQGTQTLELSETGKLFGTAGLLLGAGYLAQKAGLFGALKSAGVWLAAKLGGGVSTMAAKIGGTSLSQSYIASAPLSTTVTAMAPIAAVTAAVATGLYGLDVLPTKIAELSGGHPEEFRRWIEPYEQQAPPGLGRLYGGAAVFKTGLEAAVTAWKRLLGLELIPQSQIPPQTTPPIEQPGEMPRVSMGGEEYGMVYYPPQYPPQSQE